MLDGLPKMSSEKLKRKISVLFALQKTLCTQIFFVKRCDTFRNRKTAKFDGFLCHYNTGASVEVQHTFSLQRVYNEQNLRISNL